jgi:hypothetical protein
LQALRLCRRRTAGRRGGSSCSRGSAIEEPAANQSNRPTRQPAAIELEIDGVVARVAPGADAVTIAAVIEALKARR